MSIDVILISIVCGIALLRIVNWFNGNSEVHDIVEDKQNIDEPIQEKKHLVVEIFGTSETNYYNKNSRFFKGYIQLYRNGLGGYNILVKDHLNKDVGRLDENEIKNIVNYLIDVKDCRMFAWGYISLVFPDVVFLYLNGDNNDEIILEKMLDNLWQRDLILKKNNLSTEDFIQILELQDIVIHYCKSVNLPSNLYPEFTPSIITTFSIQLEKTKQYATLTTLSKYLYLMDDMHPKYKNTVTRRIEKAKKMLIENNSTNE